MQSDVNECKHPQTHTHTHTNPHIHRFTYTNSFKKTENLFLVSLTSIFGMKKKKKKMRKWYENKMKIYYDKMKGNVS